jgi:hypothetical protein
MRLDLASYSHLWTQVKAGSYCLRWVDERFRRLRKVGDWCGVVEETCVV